MLRSEKGPLCCSRMWRRLQALHIQSEEVVLHSKGTPRIDQKIIYHRCSTCLGTHDFRIQSLCQCHILWQGHRQRCFIHLQDLRIVTPRVSSADRFTTQTAALVDSFKRTRSAALETATINAREQPCETVRNG